MDKDEPKTWTFVHGARTVEFGPYYSEHNAKHAFQFRYGYWPNPAVSSRPWSGILIEKPIMETENHER